MKKLLACILTAAFIFTYLTACDLLKKDEKVICEKYENCAVFTFDDFPVRETVSFELERTGLGEGVIYYQVNLEEGALGISYKDHALNVAQSIGEFTADDEMPINGSGGYIEGDKIEISFGTLSPVSGEIIIAFTEDALKAVHKELHRHEHTFVYETREDTHGKIYTCDCDWLKERDFEPHYDEDNDYLCDACRYKLEPMYAFLCEYEGWLLELDANNVAEIKTMFQYVGVAPGQLKEISSTTDKNNIADMIQKYTYAQMTPITQEDTYIDGGSEFTIEFIFTDGTEKALHFNNSNYVDHPTEYYRFVSIPTLEGYDNVAKVYGFITYIGIGAVYPADLGTIPEQEPEPLCIIDGIGDMEFILIDRKPDKLPESPLYCVETQFGTLQIFGAYNFAFNGTHYLRVDGGNFLDIIEDARNSEISE